MTVFLIYFNFLIYVSKKVNCDLIKHINKLSLANESSSIKKFTKQNQTVFNKELGIEINLTVLALNI